MVDKEHSAMFIHNDFSGIEKKMSALSCAHEVVPCQIQTPFPFDIFTFFRGKKLLRSSSGPVKLAS